MLNGRYRRRTKLVRGGLRRKHIQGIPEWDHGVFTARTPGEEELQKMTKTPVGEAAVYTARKLRSQYESH